MELGRHEIKAWRDFTSGDTFAHGIEWLKEHYTPVVAKSQTAHEMAFDAGQVAGFADALKKLSRIGNPPPEEKSADQPGLERQPER